MKTSGIFPGILNPVPGALRDVYGLTCREKGFFMVAGYYGSPFKYEPVLAPVAVFLKRKSLPGPDNNPLYLVSRRIFKHAEIAPGAVNLLIHRLIF